MAAAGEIYRQAADGDPRLLADLARRVGQFAQSA